MRLRERISGLAARVSRASGAGDRKADRKDPETGEQRADPISALIRELVALGREMLAIPVEAYMALAELAGSGVLAAWRRVALPLLALAWALLAALYRLGLRHVTPARAVVAVALAGLVALVASQWLDYRGVSVGTDAYSGDAELVAPAPEVARDRAGDAHAWLMLPLAAAGLVALGLAVAGRARLARLLIPLGAAAIAISLLVDMPKGLDEGDAAIAYQGVEARLLEGFWLQIVAGAVLVVSGLLLPRYLRARPATEPRPRPAGPGPLAKLARGAAARLGGGGRDAGSRKGPAANEARA